MTSRDQSRHQHGRDSEAEREIARAEADYQRLRAAYLELAQGEDNEVALAMVGADMERANATLQSLTGLRQALPTHEPARLVKGEARSLAEENA